MAISLSGDFGRLELLIERAAKVSRPRFRRELIVDLAAEIGGLIEEGFRKGVDPTGKPWEPLKLRQGQPLNKSGRLMRAASAAQPTPDGVRVDVPLVYAAVQQYGATIRAKRVKTLRFRAGRRWIFAKQVTIPARRICPRASCRRRGARASRRSSIARSSSSSAVSRRGCRAPLAAARSRPR
jgi:phage gpG-like protein